MSKSKPDKSPNPKQPDPKDKPTRDTRDNPAPNPNGDVQNTSPREEVEKIYRNRKR
ncbi:hypothetical protein HNQ96_004618 [Aminobacter lissarensis]|uniref:Uncharacterized protein n=1 Tax=Aminobacter carboxidus TaxID=376165 RepID=A0A8E1WJZ0_9HYPH|nr:hypothetical protein [Aminobacter lissarensis]